MDLLSRVSRLVGAHRQRAFRWVSSSEGDHATLARLEQQMSWFYGNAEARERYQDMLSEERAQVIEPGSPPDELLRELVKIAAGPARVLEIGCAHGRLYAALRERGFRGAYTGIDMADHVIAENRRRYPDAEWDLGSAHHLSFPNESFDHAFAYYVLEHVVYVEKALSEMLRVLKPGGELMLVFPDFVAKRMLSSQFLGLSPGRTAKGKLKAGHLLDAALSLYDSRIRLPRHLAALREVGRFPINTAPLCLSHPDMMDADVDALYIASKHEVASWAEERGCRVRYPAGTSGNFSDNAFMAIKRPGR
jgi:SAM-dependent methyltransferase